MAYLDGFVLAVKNLDAYREMAQKASKIWVEHGALEYRECAIDDAAPTCPESDKHPEFKPYPFSKTVDARPGETVVFAYILYNSREHRDEVNAKVMSDPRIKELCKPEDMPFDPSRMAWAGFKTIVEAKK
jgi:uncharacterized protein YbaA (DUF1428 family)